MSYILDALQRKEAEAHPEAAAALALKHHKDQRLRTIVALVALAVAINVAAIIWLVWPEAQPEPIAQRTLTPTSPLPSERHDPRTLAAPPAAEEVVTAAVQAPRQATPPEANPGRASTNSRALDPPRALDRPRQLDPPRVPVRLSDLPTDVRARFPGLVFSTHIYAEDPELRAVVANGQRLVEGGRLNDAVVTTITETGAVVEFDGYLVEIPIISEWQ